MEFRYTNHLFDSLQYCLFGGLSDEELATKGLIDTYLHNEGTDRIWSYLVYPTIPYEEQYSNFSNEVITNFSTLHNNDMRATKLAGLLRNKVNKLVFEYNRFLEKISLSWGTETSVILKWVDVEPTWFISDIKTKNEKEDLQTPYDIEHPEYAFSDYIGLVIAVVKQTLTFCGDYLDLYDQSIVAIPTTQKSVSIEPATTGSGVRLQWKGDKTDLAELVWALAKSGRVADTSTGQPVTQKELAARIATLLGLDSLDVTGLMKGRMNTYKATSDGKTFTAILQELVSERAATT